ncbi:hypothetical protein [Methanoregula sp.]|uniref:hypothetical protein n=1 Tax=Methanoregula sp. TaxID=2052170 RepID=UPI003569426F
MVRKLPLLPLSGSVIAAIVSFLIIGLVLMTGCTTTSSPESGPTTKAPSATVGEIVKNPTAYEGKEVLVKGKITNECGSGCWFMLDDGTGLIYVDLAPAGFAIPQLQGSTIIVKGVIHVTNGDPALYASTVATGTRTYP